METKIYLRQCPFIRLIIPLFSGIIFQIYSPFDPDHLPWLCFSTYIILFLLLFFSPNYRSRWLFGLLINVFLFMAGIGLVQERSCHMVNLPSSNKVSIAIGTVFQPPDDKGKNIKTAINISMIKSDKTLININLKALAFIQKDSISMKIEPGDQIVFDIKSLKNVKNLINPNESGYRKYLSIKSTTMQVFIKSGRWHLIKKNDRNMVLTLAHKCRDYLLSLYSKAGLKGDEFAVISALTIGYKDKLDAGIRKAYSSTGAMHILCVSGLHVGIIFVVLNYLLFFLSKLKAGRVARPIFIIVFIWFYAVIAGMTPSIMRAAFMITFVITGKFLERSTNIYNSILASAFILLIINPLYILTTGFQLSYIAVTGIVFYNRRINRLVFFRNYFLRYSWNFFSVSIAVQLAVFPISLYYFHQFPNYFFIVNFIVIPLGTIILYLAVLLYLFSYFEPVACIVGKLLAMTAKTMNLSVLFIGHLPHSISSGISISPLETIIIYLFIIFVTLFFISKKVRFAMLSMIMIISFLFISLENKYLTLKQKLFIVYDIKGVSFYNFVSGVDNIILYDIPVSGKKFSPGRFNGNKLIDPGIPAKKSIALGSIDKDSSFNFLSENNNFYIKNIFILFNNKTICFIRNDRLKHHSSDKKIMIDYLILANNNKMRMDELVSLFNIRQLIIDPSNSRYHINQWIKDSRKYSLKCRVIADDGTFVSSECDQQ